MPIQIATNPEDLESLMQILAAITVAAVMGSISIEATAAAENYKKLSGNQIRAKLAGMQVTDEVHWREVYERDGTFRSYSMGNKKFSKWFIRKDELCIDLPEPDGGCFEVGLSGNNVELKPVGLGLPSEGLLQPPTDQK
jgi:hypothetical protein